jgi:hypothetical protein
MMRRAALVLGLSLATTLGAARAVAEEIEPPGQPRRALDGQRDRDALGWYVPDFARLGTGGFVGMFVVGTGYAAFQDVLNFSVHYGFTPASHAGTDVHAFAFGMDVRPFDLKVDDFRIVPIYLGPGLLYGWGDEFFSRLPSRYRTYDRAYYAPTSLHPLMRAGIELDYLPGPGFFERHGIYYEATVLYVYLRRYLENREQLGLGDAVGSAIGYRAAF